MSIIKKGEKAPLFNIKDQNAEDVNLENYRGKKVILSSHPLAFTSVCEIIYRKNNKRNS